LEYLESTLGDFNRFAQVNNVFFIIVAHPHALDKGKDGNYPCPDIFDLNDGAMWNNKTDNILVYHRPFRQTDPQNPLAEFHSKKIRDQKVVGKPGFILVDYHWQTRRYLYDGIDYMQKVLNEKNYTFQREQAVIKFNEPVKPVVLTDADLEDFTYGVEDRTNEF
jgi:hypothetical protein